MMTKGKDSLSGGKGLYLDESKITAVDNPRPGAYFALIPGGRVDINRELFEKFVNGDKKQEEKQEVPKPRGKK